MAAKGPTTETGTSLTGMRMPYGMVGSQFVDDFEYVPTLQWPNSVDLFKQMRNDSQIAALYAGCTLPIRNYTWQLVPNGARPELVAELAADLNLQVKGVDKTNEGRSKGRFSFSNHLRHALLATIFGYMFFEQVGEIVDGRWRLRKLGERMPSTIQEINIEQDGGLKSIRQDASAIGVHIPVDHLVAYVWDKEGGNWVGRSMLRPLYKNWLIKDRLTRVDAINHERAGAGVPVIEAPEGATDAQMEVLNNLAQTYVAGEHSGAVIPHGAKLRLVGVEGTQPKTLDSIKYHDESMARGFLAMFMQLGQTETGSRALGESFVDFMSLGQQAVARWFTDTFNEHVIEDWVDWNYGEDEIAPKLEFVVDSDKDLSVAELVALNAAGILTLDDEIKTFIRRDYNLPDPVVGDTSQSDKLQVAAKRRRKLAAASAKDDVSLPDRQLRRQPYEQEVRAATDFAALDANWVDARESLVSKVSANNQAVIDEIGSQIVAAKGELAELAGIQAAGNSADDITEALLSMVDFGAESALMEAKDQGFAAKKPDLDGAKSSVALRAEATDVMLARSLSEAGARKAIATTGGKGLSDDDVADITKKYLAGLTDSFLRDQIGGLLTAAQNSGRREVMVANPPELIYSSELLDENTCGSCTGVDGTEYASIEEAEVDYPTGGYVDCEGGERCRGTLVAVYGESASSVE